MKRRDFIKSAFALSAFGTQIPVMALGRKNQFGRIVQWDTDRILVLIKLNGGNDGLNTIIPTQDDIYYNARPSLAISPNDALTIDEQNGFHPNLSAFQSLYQNGNMSLIHGIGYPQPNLSHFRSSDIWVTGSDADQYLQTGWIGRLLEQEYPDFPSNAPEHPLAIQFNSANLLEFKTTGSNTGMMVFDPETMYNLINGNYVAGQDDPAPDTYGGIELDFVREVDLLSFEYAEVINETAGQGSNSVEYPETNLGYQMALTAQMISGGLETPSYRIYQSGYDTHANQNNDHSNLLLDLNNAVLAFMEDLSSQGLLDRVMVLTTSEFGRRYFENGSTGTDHGSSAPCMVFGNSVVPDIFGEQPSLSNLDQHNNLLIQHDFRQLYSSVITDWLGLDQEIATNVFGQEFESIPFVQSPLSVNNSPVPAKFKVHAAYPNPFNPTTMISFTLPGISNVSVRLFNLKGREIQNYNLGRKKPGKHFFRLDGRNLSSGNYILKVEAAGSVLNQKITLLK
jgi:uncharacterized protein (DUF1501 family)